jgi:hypothetical protein
VSILPPDPELIADALLSAHPDAEPFEIPAADLTVWLAYAGVDPRDEALIAATLAAWEVRRG